MKLNLHANTKIHPVGQLRCAQPGATSSIGAKPSMSAVPTESRTSCRLASYPGSAQAAETTTLAHVGPYPIKTGRERVTVEEAPVTFPNPNNVLLHSPNEITAKDFEGWVQERGLNFASEWDPRYQSVLESHDPGEKALLGGELYTKYGKGAYVFTSYDWFRQLPAGVPGAYRLFANMLSAAKVQ